MISNGDEYNSLAEALEAVSIYDHNDLIDDKDVTPQNFTVNYTPVKQTANLMVGGKLLETVTGDSDAKLTFKTTDTDLYRSGYTYKVTASNGQVYQSLAEALKAIATYDHNDLTNGKDMSPQNFTILKPRPRHPLKDLKAMNLAPLEKKSSNTA
jgi:large repetitive protein